MSLRQYDSVSCRIIPSNFPKRRQIQEKEKPRGSVVVVEERVARQRHHLNAKELGRKAGPTASQTCGSHVQLLQRNKAVRRGEPFFFGPRKIKRKFGWGFGRWTFRALWLCLAKTRGGPHLHHCTRVNRTARLPPYPTPSLFAFLAPLGRFNEDSRRWAPPKAKTVQCYNFRGV